MKKLRKVFAIVFMATMMTLSASFAGMAETAVEKTSEENYDVTEGNASEMADSSKDVSDSAASEQVSDAQNNDSFETTDKTVDENDSVEFDQTDAPEVEKEKAEEVQTTVSSGTVVEVNDQDTVFVDVDEIVIEKSEANVIISAESETVVNAPTENSFLITEKIPDLENSVQFETTSKVVDDVDVVEFDYEPIKSEVVVTPGVPEENVPTDDPPVVETPEPETPKPETPKPETPEPETTVTPEPETSKPSHTHRDNDNDRDDDQAILVPVQVSLVPVFVDEPSPHLTDTPVFVDEPAPGVLPKTGDTAPISGYIFILSLIALIIIYPHRETNKSMDQVKCFQHMPVMSRRYGCNISWIKDIFFTCRLKGIELSSAIHYHNKAIWQPDKKQWHMDQSWSCRYYGRKTAGLCYYNDYLRKPWRPIMIRT